MGHGIEVRNSTTDRKVNSKLEPDPKARQARIQAEREAAELATKEAAQRKTVVKKPKPKAAPKRKPAAQKPKASDRKSAGQYLELGCGYKIAHKPGSGYSTFYKVVASRGHFEEVVKALEAGKYNLNDANQANELLEKMLVPVDKLETYCRSDSGWKDHASKKTAQLEEKSKKGNSQAKQILKNEARCNEGEWSGNIPEMVSTCVGFYNFLVQLESHNGYLSDCKKKGKKPDPKNPSSKPPELNKNVKKFQEAGLVFRRFPLSKSSEKSFVLMYPEKFVDAVKTAILVGRGINEDE